jgi:hypothetical protein
VAVNLDWTPQPAQNGTYRAELSWTGAVGSAAAKSASCADAHAALSSALPGPGYPPLLLIVPEQQRNVSFDAFFADTMFHEVAHGLGIKNTVNGRGTVRDALKELGSGIEEGKADVLGLYMITRLHEQGELDGALEDYYTPFLAGIFRSVRFGAASAHGEANMVRFNFFAERGAFTRDAKGHYRVRMPQMRQAVNDLSAVLLKLQGDGDYAGVQKLTRELGVIRPELQADLDRLSRRAIPVDVAFTQGKSVLGLE